MTPTLRSNSQRKPHTAPTNETNKTIKSTPSNKTNKRALSPDLSSANSNSKKNKENNSNQQAMIDIEELKKFITASTTESTAKLENVIQSSHKALDSKFNDLAERVKEEVTVLKSSVVEFHNKINDELNEVKAKLSSYAERMENNDDDLQRLQRNKDLRLTGFAAKENENLHDLFAKVATAIGFELGTSATMPVIERIKLYNKTSNQITLSPTILIHFAILRQKQQFYSLYLNKMPLDPTKFNLPNENRIVIGENLTRKNAHIFKQAQIMKKNNKIAQAFTENGIVKIKLAKGKTEPAHTIRNTVELETIVMQHIHGARSTNGTVASTLTPATTAPSNSNNNSNKPSDVNASNSVFTTPTTQLNGESTATSNNKSDNNSRTPMDTGNGT